MALFLGTGVIRAAAALRPGMQSPCNRLQPILANAQVAIRVVLAEPPANRAGVLDACRRFLESDGGGQR